jgi:hypothetical protein
MKSKEAKSLEKISWAKKALELKQEELRRARNLYEKSAADVEAREKQAQSIAWWVGPRAAFAAKLRRAKEKLNTIERNLASAAKTETAWPEKFEKLLDGEDTDGTVEYAKQIVGAEIEELERKKDEGDEIARELKLEEAYRHDLEGQKTMLLQSMQNFEEHKKKVLKELRDELDVCGGKGYIDLLESELILHE